MNIETRFKDKLEQTLNDYPSEATDFRILARQTGFRLDSNANMPFLCARTAIIAILRAINRGTTVGILITASDGQWHENGIILIDTDGNFLPPLWISLAEIMLNCGDNIDKIHCQLLMNKIRNQIESELNESPEVKFTNLDEELLQVAEFPKSQVKMKKRMLMDPQRVSERRHLANVFIGYDSRPQNHVYASIIARICTNYKVHSCIIGYTSLPVLSYLVRARNGFLYKSKDDPTSQRYCQNLVSSFRRLMLITQSKNRSAYFTDSLSLSFTLSVWAICEKPSKLMYTENTPSVYIDCANGMIAPFISNVLNSIRKNYKKFNFHLFNIESNKLYFKHNNVHEPLLAENTSSFSLVSRKYTLAHTNTSETNEVVYSIMKNCGAQFVFEKRQKPLYKRSEYDSQHYELMISQEEDQRNNEVAYAKYCYSFDGDGDRVILHYETDPSSLVSTEVIDGDYMAVLFATFITSKFALIKAFKNINIGVIQNPWANKSSTNFIQNNLHLVTVSNISSLPKMKKAAAEFDVGIYFTVNGHGGVIFNQPTISRLNFINNYLRKKGNYVGDTSALKLIRPLRELYQGPDFEHYLDDFEACNILTKLQTILEKPMSDGIALFLAIEFILSFEKIEISQLRETYMPVPSIRLLWNPNTPLPAYMNNGNLPCRLLHCFKIMIDEKLQDETKIVECRLLKLMLLAATRTPPHFDISNLTEREQNVLYLMDDPDRYPQEANIVFYQGLNLDELLRMWAPKYKCFFPGCLMYYFSLLIEIMGQPELRVVVSPDDNHCFAQIYVESNIRIHSISVAEGIMLLLRLHIRDSYLQVTGADREASTPMYPSHRKRPAIREEYSSIDEFISSFGKKALRMSSVENVEGMDGGHRNEENYQMEHSQEEQRYDESMQDETRQSKTSLEIPFCERVHNFYEIPIFLNCDDYFTTTNTHPEHSKNKRTKDSCKIKVKNPFYIDKPFVKEGSVYNKAIIEFDCNPDNLVAKTIPVFESFADKTRLSPKQKRSIQRKKRYKLYGKEKSCDNNVCTVCEQYDTEMVANNRRIGEGRRKEKKVSKVNECTLLDNLSNLHMLSIPAWRNSNSFTKITRDNMIWYDFDRQGFETKSKGKSSSELPVTRKFQISNSKILKPDETVGIHIGCTRKYSYLPGLFPYFIVTALENHEHDIIDNSVTINRHIFSNQNRILKFMLEAERKCDITPLRSGKRWKYPGQIQLCIQNSCLATKRNVYHSAPQHNVSYAPNHLSPTAPMLSFAESSSWINFLKTNVLSSDISWISVVSVALLQLLSIPTISDYCDIINRQFDLHPVIYKKLCDKNKNVLLTLQARLLPKVVDTLCQYNHIYEIPDNDALQRIYNILLFLYESKIIPSRQIKQVASVVNQCVCPPHYKILSPNVIEVIVRHCKENDNDINPLILKDALTSNVQCISCR